MSVLRKLKLVTAERVQGKETSEVKVVNYLSRLNVSGEFDAGIGYIAARN